MSQPTSQADHLDRWQRRLRAMGENAADLQHLATWRESLQGILNNAQSALQEQSAARAAKQDASRRFEDLLSEGQKLFTFLSACLREFYGEQSEKLAEFGLIPFRGRRPRKSAPTPPLPEDVQ